MLLPLLAATCIAAPSAQPLAAPPMPATLSRVTCGHGRLSWFEGSFDEAAANASAQRRILFVDFWTEWCGYCKQLDREAFSCDEVVGEMAELVCLSVDAESERGAALAERYGVKAFPTLLFFSPDGQPRDAIRGYVPAGEFQAEVRRIKDDRGTIGDLRRRIGATPDDLEGRFELIGKLRAFQETEAAERQLSDLERLVRDGRGFEADDVHSRWKLYRRLLPLGMHELAREQVAAIRRLDPEGSSLPMHCLALDELDESIDGIEGIARLEAFLAVEPYAEVRFDGWWRVYGRYDRAAKKTRDVMVAAEARRESRRVSVFLWKDTPDDLRARVGNQIAWGFYMATPELTEHERRWVLEVAEKAMEASGGDVNVIDTYACCLFINGHLPEALQQVDRCIELDPENEVWRKRRREFSEQGG